MASRYPNAIRPWQGIALEERVRSLFGSGRAIASVVAPVPWFPFRARWFGPWSVYARVPAMERRFNVVVHHPVYFLRPLAGPMRAARAIAHSLAPALRQWQRRGADFDLIEAHGLCPDGVAAARLGEMLGKPVVINVHEREPALIDADPAQRRQLLATMRNVHAVMAASRALRTELVACGFAGSRTWVRHDGVDLGRFRMTGHNTTKAKFRLSGTVWITVGALEPQARTHLALEALAHVPDATLLLMGSGRAENHLRHLAGELGVDSRVHFMGRVAHNQLPRYYNAADALVHTADGAALANAVLESLACGTPVIAAPSAGVAELLASYDAGEVATDATGAALAAAWMALAERAAERAATRAVAEGFGWAELTRSRVADYAAMLAVPTDAADALSAR